MSLKDKIQKNKAQVKEPSKSTQSAKPSQEKPVAKKMVKRGEDTPTSTGDYDASAMKIAGVKVMASFQFAKDQYTRALGILILSLIIATAVVFETYYVVTYKPPVKYIPVYEDSTIIDPVPLNKPFKTDEEMRQWLADSVKIIFSYDYLNVDVHGNDIKQKFTEKGYSDFMDKFQNSPDIPRVKNKKMEVIASSIGSPKKLHQGDKISGNNFAYWEYEFTLRQVFISPTEGIIPVTYQMVATIVRQDQREFRDGIAIHSFRVVSSNSVQ